MSVETGLDLIVKDKCAGFRKKKVAVLANQASVDRNCSHLLKILKANDITVAKLFAPEHGFNGILQDMESVVDSTDPLSNLEVISLYGSGEQSLKPKPDQLADIDVLIVDLPDIGSRYYTFAQSMTYCMQVAAETETKVVVLDRPNPIGGTEVEGVGLLAKCRSFCGYSAIAQRHGLTLGEIARLVNTGFGQDGQSVAPINCNLEVISVTNWQREDYFDATELPWVLPSVNMPTLDTAIVYPGACLFEATNLSEGRGTTKPFELIGAPYIDGVKWSEATLNEEISLFGAILRPTEFKPKFQKHADSVCQGVQIHVIDRSSFQPFRWSIALISAAKRLYPKKFAWRADAYEFVDKIPAIDLLYGSAKLRNIIDNSGSLETIEKEIEIYSDWYKNAISEYIS